MVGIVGIDRPGQRDLVAQMLNKITHRGKAGKLNRSAFQARPVAPREHSYGERKDN